MVHRKLADKPRMIVVSGSCTDFNKDRVKIMEFIKLLESGARTESKAECSSVGKKYMGWEFFNIYFEPDFIPALLDVYPDIEKQEAGTVEDRFVLWLDKQLKKKKLRYNLKLSDVPTERAHGFKLDPENYRSDAWMERMR